MPLLFPLIFPAPAKIIFDLLYLISEPRRHSADYYEKLGM